MVDGDVDDHVVGVAAAVVVDLVGVVRDVDAEDVFALEALAGVEREGVAVADDRLLPDQLDKGFVLPISLVADGDVGLDLDRQVGAAVEPGRLPSRRFRLPRIVLVRLTELPGLTLSLKRICSRVSLIKWSLPGG